jgi:glycosyltransferase involved in cell wall biosynthesis
VVKLTIFTATYNRAHLLPRLFKSLKRQGCFDFEWLVIDDGSVDKTTDLFEDFLKEELPFSIRFYTQENQGLIRTLNSGISLAKGCYLIKMDSDDYVMDDFVENICRWIDEIDSNKKIYAVGGLRVTAQGMPLKGKWPIIPKEGYVDASDIERKQYNLDADMTEAWRLEVLRRYPFPVWPTEKFAPEQIVTHQIAIEGYKIRWRAVPLTICEYQEGGLTLGASTLEKKNPMGYAMMYEQQLDRPDFSFQKKICSAMNMFALTMIGRTPSYYFKNKHKVIKLLAFIPGVLLFFRRIKQFVSNGG